MDTFRRRILLPATFVASGLLAPLAAASPQNQFDLEADRPVATAQAEPSSPWFKYGLGTAGGIAGLVTLLLSARRIRQQSKAVVERFGKFHRIAEPGLRFFIPFVDQVAERMNLRVQPLEVAVETKTADDVFVHLKVSVQYFVKPEKVFDAYYKLSDPNGQITSYVFDVVRARVPKLKLDEVFEKKDEIADAVKTELEQVMDDYGYGIVKALVTDIDPDEKVKEAMNEINAATRLRVAASEKGEAERILKVKAAEAEAQSKALQGKGIADQRRAIVEGLKDSVAHFQEAVVGSSAEDVMRLVLITQYLDTLKELGMHSRTNTIMLPHSPGGLTDLEGQIRNAMIGAGAVKAAAADKPEAPKKS